MDNNEKIRLDLLTRSVHALLQWAETHPLTQWEQAGTLSALRSELEEAIENEPTRNMAVNESASVR
jgi:hypothetical protein